MTFKGQVPQPVLAVQATTVQKVQLLQPKSLAQWVHSDRYQQEAFLLIVQYVHLDIIAPLSVLSLLLHVQLAITVQLEPYNLSLAQKGHLAILSVLQIPKVAPNVQVDFTVE